MFSKVPQSSLGILRVPQLPPPLEHSVFVFWLLRFFFGCFVTAPLVHLSLVPKMWGQINGATLKLKWIVLGVETGLNFLCLSNFS